jgi:DNA polymerase-3 subunit delta
LAKVIKTAFTQIVSDTLLIIQATELSKKGSALVALATEFDDFVAIACYEDRDDSIAEVIKNKIAKEGFTIDYDALDMMVSRLGADRKSNMAEIEKLMVYMGDKRNITMSHVDQVVSDIAGANAEDVSYFLASGRLEKALNKYNAMVNEGVQPASILRILYGHFARLLQVHAFREQGLSEEDAIKKIYPPVIFFRKNEFKEQIRAWPKEKLLRIIELLQETEKDCKTTGYPDVLLVSYCMMKIFMAYKR